MGLDAELWSGGGECICFLHFREIYVFSFGYSLVKIKLSICFLYLQMWYVKMEAEFLFRCGNGLVNLGECLSF